MTKSVTEQLRNARAVGVPEVAIESLDQGATVAEITRELPNGRPIPIVQWDLIRGFTALTDAGVQALAKIDNPADQKNPADALVAALNLPGATAKGVPNPVAGTVMLVHQAHRYLEAPDVVQGLLLIRDAFKRDGRTLVLLGPDFAGLPAEVASDVYVINEPLPTPEQLGSIVDKVCSGPRTPDASTREKAVNAVRGLHAFAAEQAVALSLTKTNLVLDTLWERKRQVINATPGLSVWKGVERFSDLRGLDPLEEYARQIIAGRRPPRAIVFVDEVEKGMAGSAQGTQSSDGGASQAILQTFLTEIQNQRYDGIICVGVPGAGKSAFAKAFGNEAGCPTIAMDVAGFKGGIVGTTEANVRRGFEVVRSISDGQALFIITSNNIEALPPELKRRFKLGTFFFDLPAGAEQLKIWEVFTNKLNLPKQNLPAHAGWTGAEIEACCEIAYNLNVSLQVAARKIVPVALSGGTVIERLRREASGKYLSAATGDVYTYQQLGTVAAGGSERRMDLDS